MYECYSEIGTVDLGGKLPFLKLVLIQILFLYQSFRFINRIMASNESSFAAAGVHALEYLSTGLPGTGASAMGNI